MSGRLSVILLAIVIIMCISQFQVEGGSHDLCSTPGDQCGEDCITEYECSRIGCCWQHGDNVTNSQCLTGAKHKNGLSSSEWQVCTSVKSDLPDDTITVENCGWPGTSWEDCLEMGCCWDVINQHQQPSCYKLISTDNTTSLQNGFHDEDLRIHENRLEINFNGVWGMVCGANFKEREAQVACRQMGFNNTEHAQIHRLNQTRDGLTSWINFVHCDGTEKRLASCSHQPWYQHCPEQFNISCEPNQVENMREGDLRLTGGPKASWGRLEILHNGIWGSVCNHGFSDREAGVVCRQLNHRGGRVRKATSYGHGRKIIWLDAVHCSGTEASLDACEHNEWGVHDCTRKDVVSVDCGYSDRVGMCSINPYVNLTSNTGVLHSLNFPAYYSVNSHCYWRITVEPDKIIYLNLTHFCGYPNPHQLHVYDGPTASNTRILHKYGMLSGSSLIKLYSSSNTVYVKWVVSTQHAYSSCNPKYGFELLYNATHRPSGEDVRFVGGIGYHSGRLEVDLSTFDSSETGWATICDEQFTEANARVVCRQMDFYGGTVVGGAHFGAGSAPVSILLHLLNCTGQESELSECPRQRRNAACNHNRDVSVICDLHPSGPEPEEGDLRLEGGPAPSTGRLEVYHERRWGTVCDDRFGQNEARVACRQLGYKDGQVYNISSDIHPYRSRRMKVWLDEVRCHDDEYVLHHCRHAGWENTDCNHDEDIAITCSGYEWETIYEDTNRTTVCSTEDTTCNGELRLVGGNNRTTGLVQAFHHGEWGTICQRNLAAHQVAEVACRQLGLVGGMVMLASWYHDGQMELGRQWFDNLQCDGDEGRLKDCFHHGWSAGDECVAPAEPLAIDCGRNASVVNSESAHTRTPRSVDEVARKLSEGESVANVGQHDDVTSGGSTGTTESTETTADPCVCRVHGDPIINTYDDQVLRLESPGTYMMTKMVNESDICWFSVELCTRRSASGAIYTDHVTIEYDTSHIHLHQDSEVQIGQDSVSLTNDKYIFSGGLGFTIYENPTNTFTLFEASTHSNCSILVLFKGQGEDSVVAVQAGGQYASNVHGLCGDCNGQMDDLKTAHGEDVSDRSNKFELIAQSWWSNDCDAQP